MRSIVGPLIFGLLPLFAAGCVLPDRPIMGRAEDLGFRPRGATSPRVSSGPSSQESISFRSPEKNQRVRQGDTEQPGQFAAKTGLTDDPIVADGATLVPGHSSDFASRSLDHEAWPSSKDSSPSTSKDGNGEPVAQSKATQATFHAPNSAEVIPDAGTRQAGYRSDIDETANPIQQQNREIVLSEFKSKKPSRSIETSEAPVSRLPTAPGPSRKFDAPNSSPPLWSERTAERNSVKQANGLSTNGTPTNPVRQIAQTESTPNRSRYISSASLRSLPWQAELEQLISRVEQDLSQSKSTAEGDPAESLRRHAHLRLLYLMAQRQEDAMTAIPGVDALQQEYWQQLVWAMSNSFDTVQHPDPSERASHVVPPLSSALRQMREQAELSIKNMTFCRKISYFGNYERFPRNEFTAGHEVLLYTEIENFVSSPTADGEYRTSLKSMIEIADSRGKIVWTKGFPSTEDFCRNPRRDYFHNYQFYIPEDLSTGAYTLKLTIVDELSKKQASNSLNFVLK